MNLIVAIDQNNIIGDNMSLPWKVPEDMVFFKEMTINHIVIMGRKTFETLSSPLQNRINVVITSQPIASDIPNLYFRNMDTIHDTLQNLQETYPEKKVFVIGGNQTYELFFPFMEKLYITKIYREETNGDTFFSKKIIDKIETTGYEKTIICSLQESKNPKYKYEIIQYRKI